MIGQERVNEMLVCAEGYVAELANPRNTFVYDYDKVDLRMVRDVVEHRLVISTTSLPRSGRV